MIFNLSFLRIQFFNLRSEQVWKVTFSFSSIVLGHLVYALNTNIVYQPVQVPVYAHEYKHSISTSTNTGICT